MRVGRARAGAVGAVMMAAVLCLLGGTPVRAQDVALETVERLAASGRLTDARATLERWNQDHPETSAVAGEVRAHALLLAARLAVDPGAAEAGYLAVALGYPSSPHAAEALLRLGQGLVLAAEAGTRADGATRAAGFLERLVSDYPGSPHRATGQLWLVRANVLSGRLAQACEGARDALSAGVDDEDLADMLRVELATHCEGRTPERTARAPVPDPAVPSEPPARAAPSADARFTVQSAAMSEEARATALAAALRTSGFDARVVRIEGSRLVRVRVGRFTAVREAEALAARMRAARFEAVVVGDAHHEIVR